jgi:Uma2 family endonuclease
VWYGSPMSHQPDVVRGYSVDAYFCLVTDGLLDPRDRVELLDGVIVAEPPMEPPHASGITYGLEALQRAVGGRAVIRVQAPFIADAYSAPEPDLAVVPGRPDDYLDRHPNCALLVVEVSDTSLQQDRLSKSRIYAGAGVPDYWIVNLRGDCVEVFRTPDAAQRVYTDRFVAPRGETLELVALPGAIVALDDLLLPSGRGAPRP